MVTRHTERPSTRARGSGVCIDCGERYLFASAYKGNYCVDCHETRIEQSSPTPSRGAPPRLRPASPLEERADAAAEPYDEA